MAGADGCGWLAGGFGLKYLPAHGAIAERMVHEPVRDHPRVFIE